jgi:hypothetical protein
MTDHQDTQHQPAPAQKRPTRCWINQPSTLQAGHKYHGTNVLAAPYGEDSYDVYFLSGETTSMVVPASWLSNGWKVDPPAQQQVAAPDGYVLMPAQLTAENGAKGALSGEFTIAHESTCSACDEDDEDCDVCGGEGQYVTHVTVPWDSIKDIYAAAVKACGSRSAPVAPQSAEPAISRQVAELLDRYRRDLERRTFPDNDEGDYEARWAAGEIQLISNVLSGQGKQ